MASALCSSRARPILAAEVANGLQRELMKRNLMVEIHVCATRLEEKGGRWTGQVLGQPMFGEAKAIAVWWFAEKWKLNLAQCAAYGDSVHDQWMLASVGKPVAVIRIPFANDSTAAGLGNCRVANKIFGENEDRKNGAGSAR